VGIRPAVSWWDPEPGPGELIRRTVGGVLDDTASRYPAHEAVAVSAYPDLGYDVRWTYRELRSRANRLARALMAFGIRPGDRVAVWAPNVAPWLAAEFAIAKAGATLVTLNPTYRAEEAAYVLGHAQVVGCLFLPSFGEFDVWSELQQAAADLPSLRLRCSLTEPVGDVPGLEEFLAASREVGADELAARQAEVEPEGIAQIQYTSGTTGRPKGAMLTHANIVNNARLTMLRWRVGPADRWCNPMPFFHTTGCVMMALGIAAAGATHCPIVWFDADRVLDTIQQERCSFLETVPTTLIAILQHQRREPRDLSSLQVIGTSGALVPPSLVAEVRSVFGAELRVLYGLTEASPTITCTDPGDPPETQGVTTGRALPWTEVRIVGPDGAAVPPGTPGELQTRGFLVMAGYLHQPEDTARAIDPAGWLTTGDVAVMDAGGYVSIVARSKDVVIRGGENIYPAEIEDLLRQYPGVVEACVVGVPDPFFGEELCAVVRTETVSPLDGEDLRAFLRARVTHQKVPRHVLQVDGYPKTASGKIQKFRVRERALRSLGLADDGWETVATPPGRAV
jgi:fatty-acyl-CoA synthase